MLFASITGRLPILYLWMKFLCIADCEDIDIILSHTCPKKYIPTEMFLPMVDQSTVDSSMEEWLDRIEDTVNYKAWYCGHWHTDKRIDKMHFLYKTFECLDD